MLAAGAPWWATDDPMIGSYAHNSNDNRPGGAGANAGNFGQPANVPQGGGRGTGGPLYYTLQRQSQSGASGQPVRGLGTPYMSPATSQSAKPDGERPGTQGEPYKSPAPPRSPNVYGTMSATPAPVTSTASPGYSTVQRTDPRTGQLGLPTPNGGMTMDANTANPLNKAYAPPPPAQSTFTGVDGKPATSLDSMFAGRDALITRLQQQQSVYAGSNGKDLGRPTYTMPNGFGQSQTHTAAPTAANVAPVSPQAAPTTNTPDYADPNWGSISDEDYNKTATSMGDERNGGTFFDPVTKKFRHERNEDAEEGKWWQGLSPEERSKADARETQLRGERRYGPFDPPLYEDSAFIGGPADQGRSYNESIKAKNAAEEKRYASEVQAWNAGTNGVNSNKNRAPKPVPPKVLEPVYEQLRAYTGQAQSGPPPASEYRQDGRPDAPPNAAFLNRQQEPAASPTSLRTLTQDDRYNPNIALFDANQATSENAKKLGANFTPFQYDPSWSVPTASEAPNSANNPTNEQRYNLPSRGVNPNIAIFEANQAGDQRAASGGAPAQPYSYYQSWPEPVQRTPANSTGNRTNAPVYKFRTYN